jgi:hypothetical protein
MLYYLIGISLVSANKKHRFVRDSKVGYFLIIVLFVEKLGGVNKWNLVEN